MNVNINRSLIELDNGLYLDAVVTSTTGLVQFFSIWGRDGVMQHFFAALTLPLSEGGLRVMTVTLPGGINWCSILHKQKCSPSVPLDYLSLPRWESGCIPGCFNRMYKNQGGKSMTVLSAEPQSWIALWPTLKQLCHLPLLDEWESALQPRLRAHITVLPSYGLHGYLIDLPIEEIETLITNLLQQGLLPLNKEVYA